MMSSLIWLVVFLGILAIIYFAVHKLIANATALVVIDTILAIAAIVAVAKFVIGLFGFI